MNLESVLPARHVKRFHTSTFIGQQTVADHSWGVAVIALHLCQGLSAEETFMVVRAALLHDVTERWTGDMPGDFKAQNPQMKQEYTLEEGKLEVSAGISDVLDLAPGRMAIVAMADKLDLMHTIVDQQKLGNRSLGYIFNNASIMLTHVLNRYPNPWAAEMQQTLRKQHGL